MGLGIFMFTESKLFNHFPLIKTFKLALTRKSLSLKVANCAGFEFESEKIYLIFDKNLLGPSLINLKIQMPWLVVINLN